VGRAPHRFRPVWSFSTSRMRKSSWSTIEKVEIRSDGKVSAAAFDVEPALRKLFIGARPAPPSRDSSKHGRCHNSSYLMEGISV
jgi:hypothetical protein